ncbi:RNA polymerase sigma factor [Streptomyces sp. NPDC004266]|uniref:RNA polymerase sigma factor n=1 Tax=Streptomyces sp. NPDC004266 TaxID=3364693 RepID=UPI0036CF334C
MTEEGCPPTYDGDPEVRFAEVRGPMFRTAFAMGGDPHLADDAVQTALIKVLRKFPDLSVVSPERLTVYSKAVVRNAVRDEFRKNSRGKLQIIPSQPEDLPDSVSVMGLPEGVYEELRAGIHEYVYELPQRHKEAVFLCILRNVHPADTADVMEVSEATVKRYLNSALRMLQKKMSPSSEEVSA